MHHRDDPRRSQEKRDSFGKRRAHMQILKSPKKKTAQSLSKAEDWPRGPEELVFYCLWGKMFFPVT